MKANPSGALTLGSQIRNILLSAAFMTTAALAMAPLAHAQDEPLPGPSAIANPAADTTPAGGAAPVESLSDSLPLYTPRRHKAGYNSGNLRLWILLSF